ncbi:MAG: (2Fe-2S)-binding protein [Thiotrichales bacterium]|nr:(2Fe-2S)-binding protein [Thiotrichales bacterium]
MSETQLTQRWLLEWQKQPQRNLCVCYDVPKEQVMRAIEQGAHNLEAVSIQTYACQGAGCCVRQVERLLTFYHAYQAALEESPKTPHTNPRCEST